MIFVHFINIINSVYYIKNNKVTSSDFNIKWHGGFAISQKMKNVNELHNLISEKLAIPLDNILEVSTKSSIELGRKLSSFNLQLTVNNARYNLESVYQSSKVFRSTLGTKQHLDLIDATPIEARKSLKEEDHKTLISFRFMDIDFPLKPKHLFYDWLYINAINQIPNVFKSLSQYKYFTDIEFNPEKSLNCQARSLVLYIWLVINKKLEEYLKEPRKFYRNVINEK